MSLSNSHCHTSSDVVRRSDRIVADEHDDSQERDNNEMEVPDE